MQVQSKKREFPFIITNVGEWGNVHFSCPLWDFGCLMNKVDGSSGHKNVNIFQKESKMFFLYEYLEHQTLKKSCEG